jgi:lipopolysaccharide export system permease protein
MKKIDKLIIKSFIGPFVLTTTVVVFIFLMRFLMMYFNDFVGKDLGLEVFGKLFLYFSLITVPISLPLATLLSALICFGNLGEHTELTAMKSAGIPTSRIILPVLIFGFFISVFSFWYNNKINPWANLKGYSLLWDVKSTKVTLNIQEGVFYRELPNYSIKVQKKLSDGKTLKNVMVYDHTGGDGNKNVTVADSGKMYTIYDNAYLIFELFNGANYIDYRGNNSYNETQFVKNKFKKNKLVFSLNSFGIKRTDENQFKYHELMKDISQLGVQIDSTRKEINKTAETHINSIENISSYQFKVVNQITKTDSSNKKSSLQTIKPGNWIEQKLKPLESKSRVNEFYDNSISSAKNVISQLETNELILSSKKREMYKADVERWHKLTMALACLVMIIIGASLGSIIKKGGFGLPVLLSISFFIFMYILMQLGDKYAKEGIIPVIVGVWIPDVVLLLIGLFLLRKASLDARIFDTDVYAVFFDKLKIKINKIKKQRNQKLEIKID